MSEFKLLHAHPIHVPEIVEMLKSVPGTDGALATQGVMRAIEEELHPILVLPHKGMVIGCVALHPSGDWMGGLRAAAGVVVHKEFWGKRLGLQMLTAAASMYHVTRIECVHSALNKNAVRFAESAFTRLPFQVMKKEVTNPQHGFGGRVFLNDGERFQVDLVREEDFDEVEKLTILFEKYMRSANPQIYGHDYRRRLIDGLERSIKSPMTGTVVLLKTRDGRSVGAARVVPQFCARRNEYDLWLRRVFIMEEYRNRGLFGPFLKKTLAIMNTYAEPIAQIKTLVGYGHPERSQLAQQILERLGFAVDESMRVCQMTVSEPTVRELQHAS